MSGATRGRIGGLVHYLAGGADHFLRLELGNRLAVLLPAPVDAVTVVYSTGGPKSWCRRSSSSASSWRSYRSSGGAAASIAGRFCSDSGADWLVWVLSLVASWLPNGTPAILSDS